MNAGPLGVWPACCNIYLGLRVYDADVDLLGIEFRCCDVSACVRLDASMFFLKVATFQGFDASTFWRFNVLSCPFCPTTKFLNQCCFDTLCRQPSMRIAKQKTPKCKSHALKITPFSDYFGKKNKPIRHAHTHVFDISTKFLWPLFLLQAIPCLQRCDHTRQQPR